MIEKEEIAYIIQEIKDHPEKPWNTPNKELAKAVFAQIREEYPQTTLCDAWINSWILLDQLRASEEENLRAWLDQKITQMQDWRESWAYNDQICLCERDQKIQLYKGIETLAGCLGAELAVEKWEDKEVLHLFYKGWKIMQLGRSEEK